MGIHFPHNIRIRLARLNFFFLHPDFPPLKLLFFNVFLQQVGVKPSWYATPPDFPPPKSWVSELSSEVRFVSVLAIVLSEYWKRLGENFRNKVISTISQNDENCKNIFPPESSLFQYSERTIASTETIDASKENSDTQLFAARKFEGVGLSGGLHAHLPQKDIEKKVNLTEESRAFKKNLIAPILFLYHEESVCPLLLNYNKVYLVSSLIAKPSLHIIWIKYWNGSGSGPPPSLIPTLWNIGNLFHKQATLHIRRLQEYFNHIHILIGSTTQLPGRLLI